MCFVKTDSSIIPFLHFILGRLAIGKQKWILSSGTVWLVKQSNLYVFSHWKWQNSSHWTFTGILPIVFIKPKSLHRRRRFDPMPADMLHATQVWWHTGWPCRTSLQWSLLAYQWKCRWLIQTFPQISLKEIKISLCRNWRNRNAPSHFLDLMLPLVTVFSLWKTELSSR